MFNNSLKAATGLTLLACTILGLTSISTHKWTVLTSGSIGLWKSCDKQGCINISEDQHHKGKVPGWLHVVRAFGCLSIITYFITFTYHILSWVILTRSRHNYITTVFIIISGGLMFLSMALYTRNFDEHDFKWGWSYYLGWLSFLLTLASFSISLVYSRSAAKEEERIRKRSEILIFEDC